MLKVSDLHVKYDHNEALKGVDFEIREGQIISLIGVNGAGKSSFLKALSGLLPYEGMVMFLEENLHGVDAQDITHKGLVQVPEGRRIFSGMSVYENLLLGAYGRKDKHQVQEEIDRLFEKFPILKTRKDQDAHTLSGGEQQMLALSRALLSKPKLLLLDEPSMGLAPLIVKQIFTMIKEINQEGVSIILVEQNAKAALEIADYAYLLDGGTIRMQGVAHEMKDSKLIQEIYLGV